MSMATILLYRKPAKLCARISNESTKTIEKITVKLLAKVDAVSPLKEQECQITIPANHVSTFGSQVINVHHFLRVTVHFKGIFNRSVSSKSI
uniref:Arrestin_C domain-containing protein n=2 Tax=Caenorhabditis tropicalis TaxID=1561998 RepID=A0A1I7U231_9PELO